MAKKSTPQGEISLSIEIREHLALYGFSEGLRRDATPEPPMEHLSLWLIGDVVAPEAKRGREVQVTITESEHAGQAWRNFDPAGAVIGSLSWGAGRAARVYIPPGTLWHLAHGVASGLFTRLQLLLAGPIRGNVDVRGVHMMTRELTLAGFGERSSD